jgi:drug/metabolite transporter (DMT)-like permease
VNPVVALIIGHELGGERIGTRTIVGCVLVLASTVALLRRREGTSSSGSVTASGPSSSRS